MGEEAFMTSKTKLPPMRDVRSNKMNYPSGVGAFRVVELSCGHCLIRQPAQKVPRRARCWECQT